MERIIEKTTDNNQIHSDDFYQAIKPLKSWLFKELGMREVIEKMTIPHWQPATEKQIRKFNRGIRLIKKTSMPKDLIERNIERSKTFKMIYDEKGKWHPVNKLKTNYSDIAVILTQLVERAYKDKPEKTMVWYKRIIDNPKEGLLQIKPYLEDMVLKYFTFEDLCNNVSEIKKFSKSGEQAEETVIEWLEYLGYTIEYHGGDGDLIDMLFGTDLIISNSDGKYFTIQVKRSKLEFQSLDYLNVDWLIFVKPIITVFERETRKELKEADLMVD